MDGLVIRIHFPGWSSKHDRWLSLQSDWKSLAPINLLSGRQREGGGPLNPEQATATYHYLLTGALPAGIDIGESDSEYSMTSSDAGNSCATSRTNSRGANRSGNNSRGKTTPELQGAEGHGFDPEDFPLLSIGLKVEVQDLFRTKNNEGVKAKWRVAEVINIMEDIVRIHFVGWDPKWDEDINITMDRNRIREYTNTDGKNNKYREENAKVPKKVKEQPRKSFNAYERSDRFPKQLTPVQEVSERSSPSISHSSSGVVVVDSSGNSEKFLFEAISGALGASNSGLDVLLEDMQEDFSRRSSNKEKSSNTLSTTTDTSSMSVDDKIRIAVNFADDRSEKARRNLQNSINSINNNMNNGLPLNNNSNTGQYNVLIGGSNSQNGTKSPIPGKPSSSTKLYSPSKQQLSPSYRPQALSLNNNPNQSNNSPNQSSPMNSLNNNLNISTRSSQSSQSNKSPSKPPMDLKNIRKSFNINPTPESARKSEVAYKDRLEHIGLFIKKVADDGNSLFRAVSHQMYLTENKHTDLRKLCVAHMLRHKERFEMFCTEDFDVHVQSIKDPGSAGDDLEIRVLEEVLDRMFYVYRGDSHIYDVKLVPHDVNEEELKLVVDVDPIRILFLAHGVYSSIVDELVCYPLEERDSDVLVAHRLETFSGNSMDM